MHVQWDTCCNARRAVHQQTASRSSTATAVVCAPIVTLSPPFTGKDTKVSKAAKAAKAVKKNTWKKERKPRYSVVFHRPKTLKTARDPKYPRIRYGCVCRTATSGCVHL